MVMHYYQKNNYRWNYINTDSDKIAVNAKSNFDVYESQQRVFLDFVLKQYVESGVGELDDAKLPELLNLKYKAIADAKRELGNIQYIRDTFIGFQEYLYEN